MLLVCWQSGWDPTFPVINSSWAPRSHQKAPPPQKRGCWSRHSESRSIIYFNSLFTQKHNNPHRFGPVGSRKGNNLYQQRDLQSLEKQRIQLYWENKSKGSGAQSAAGPKPTPSGFDWGSVSGPKKLQRKVFQEHSSVCFAMNLFFPSTVGRRCLLRHNTKAPGLRLLFAIKHCCVSFVLTLSAQAGT